MLIVRSDIAPRGVWVELDPVTIREAAGPGSIDPHAVACLRFDVLAAVHRFEDEIAAGAVAVGPRLVRGRPLADWLDLGEVARLGAMLIRGARGVKSPATMAEVPR